MHYREFAPHPQLRPFVRTYWTLAGRASDMPPQPVLPDGCTELIVHRERPFTRFDGVMSHAQTARLFVGQMLTPIVISPDGDADLVSIRFEPFGAHALLGAPQSTLTDHVVTADDLSLPWLTRAMRRAESAATAHAALALLERALLRRFSDAWRPTMDARVAAAVGVLLQTNGAARIDAAAAAAGTTGRHLERLFHEHIGVTPKHLARVFRFQATAQAALEAPHQPLAAISADAGYFDQAHMVREFVTLAGTTPSQFRNSLGALTKVMLS
jgi:methylphosphotriester-DNA--protein-cysteine methyltransferase